MINSIGYIAKDVIYYGSGCHIGFLHLISKEKKIYTANIPDENGDGIKAIGGHRTNLIFAFSENCINSDIYVKSYPDFTPIQTISGKERAALTSIYNLLIYHMNKIFKNYI